MSERGFPYPEFRVGQRELAEKVSKAASEGGMLIIRAPAGYGKTPAVIYGLLNSGVDRVLYLVRTVNEVDPVIRELKRFGAGFTFLFSARRICPFMGGEGRVPPPYEDFWENCRISRLKGACSYYLRVPELDTGWLARYLLEHVSVHGIRIAWDIAKFRGACPFFALKGLVSDVAFIVATYPYLFRGDIYESVFEGQGYGDFVVVVDEAHSLLNAHSLLEIRVSERDLSQAIREAERYVGRSSEAAASLRSLLENFKRASRQLREGRLRLLDKDRFLRAPGDLGGILEAAREVRERMIMEALSSGKQDVGGVRASITRVAEWLSYLDHRDVFLFGEMVGSQAVLTATPLDPAMVVSKPLEGARAVIMMSGTMPPGEFTSKVLGVGREKEFLDVEMVYGKVMPPGNLLTCVSSDVTTAFRQRGKGMYAKIAEYLGQIHRALPGAKLAVYPSYEVMHGVVEHMSLDLSLVVEDKSMNLESVEERLVEGDEALINAVAGGKLVEGVEFVDYEGRNMLSTVVVVGVPFPQPDDYTRKRLEVLSKRLGERDSRHYVYVVSTIIKVLQALGRARRSPEDKAVYFLLDYRYLRKDLRGLLNLRFDVVFSGVYGLTRALERAQSHLVGLARRADRPHSK